MSQPVHGKCHGTREVLKSTPPVDAYEIPKPVDSASVWTKARDASEKNPNADVWKAARKRAGC